MVLFGLFLLAGLWIAWLAQAVLSAIQVHKFSCVFLHKLHPHHVAYRPAATVIVPFKGIDDDLQACIRSLCEQDYRDYRLLLVVESEDDPAHAVLKNELAKYPKQRAEILVAGLANENEGQKVHNQLYAIKHLNDHDQVWVFADSDAVPGPDWLGNMVGPLWHDDTGMTTGYRWLMPIGDMDDGCQGTLASRLASVINSSVACTYRKHKLSQAWGGSMAIRAEVARQGDLQGRLTGALTDDYPMTQMCRALGKRVYFVPRCLVATPVDFSAASLCNFAHRQYLITRIYAPRIFYVSLFITTLYVAGLASAWIVLVRGLIFHPHSDDWVWPLLTLMTVAIANQVRATFRQRVVRRAFDATTQRHLAPSLWLDRWATSGWMVVHWLLVLRALFGRTMTWRGTRYRLHGPQRIQRLS